MTDTGMTEHRGTQRVVVDLYDTETTHLWDFKNDDMNHPDQPHIVQLAWVKLDLHIAYSNRNNKPHVEVTERVLNEGNYILKPIDETYNDISDTAEEIHGISLEMAQEKGIDPYTVMDLFINDLAESNVHVCHNYQFDSRLIVRTLNALKRRAPDLSEAQKVCTMLKTTSLCKLPHFRGYKWPKLIELHKFLFGEEFEGAHDAMVDVIALRRCFIELVRRGHITL